ncbi:hypothetical protein BST81_00740 [Leptolyngbya sp. 'hensonii']|uniref:CGLD27 family protein n=1 Tax=Leptolyngbya sp. 'hensonii' TaxID=1922337 RepID=UPI000950042F|nr:CGLD27 family protein [Leptolyngbya sp. 'hensonii']OLP20298.1 hypothetical protein BST81_00740 [Leptolyngbya sp. 'hensonii']
MTHHPKPVDVLTTGCPVPEEQQPINEYVNLKESWFYRWAALELRGYLTPMVWIWGLSWVLIGPIAATSFPPARHLTQFLLSSTLGTLSMLLFPLGHLYLGWVYVCDRLRKDTIFYEESGWYDGQQWSKPPEVILRDRLIVSHEIQPVLRRLQITFLVLVSLLLVGSLLWLWI